MVLWDAPAAGLWVFCYLFVVGVQRIPKRVARAVCWLWGCGVRLPPDRGCFVACLVLEWRGGWVVFVGVGVVYCGYFCMIIGFLGKGGSGKSSIATQMALSLRALGKGVFAIDADHNMDFAYNITGGALPSGVSCLGEGLDALRSMLGLREGDSCDRVFLEDFNDAGGDGHFSLNPADLYTQKYSCVVGDGLRLMMAGSQTDAVLYGKACSHILTTPLKIYLPLLEVDDGSVVLMDEKAGADGVSTGIVTGIDVGVIVCEPSLHSVKTARQIAELMDFFETPYVFVGNKVTDDADREFITEHLGVVPAAFFSDATAIKRDPFSLASAWYTAMVDVYRKVTPLNKRNRLERTQRKFERNHSFRSV